MTLQGHLQSSSLPLQCYLPPPPRSSTLQTPSSLCLPPLPCCITAPQSCPYTFTLFPLMLFCLPGIFFFLFTAWQNLMHLLRPKWIITLFLNLPPTLSVLGRVRGGGTEQRRRWGKINNSDFPYHLLTRISKYLYRALWYTTSKTMYLSLLGYQPGLV